MALYRRRQHILHTSDVHFLSSYILSCPTPILTRTASPLPPIQIFQTLQRYLHRVPKRHDQRLPHWKERQVGALQTLYCSLALQASRISRVNRVAVISAFKGSADADVTRQSHDTIRTSVDLAAALSFIFPLPLPFPLPTIHNPASKNATNSRRTTRSTRSGPPLSSCCRTSLPTST